MEFLFIACNANQSVQVNKTKLARWRHLDSLFCLLLIVGLTFFVIMQNGRLREEMKKRLNDDVIDQIVSERVIPIFKELEEIKNIILEENSRTQSNTDQIKKMVKSMYQQLGLPLVTQLQTHLDNHHPVQKQQAKQLKNTYQVFQIYQNQEPAVQQPLTIITQQIDVSKDSQHIWEVQISQKEMEYQNQSEETCSYLQYSFPGLKRSVVMEQGEGWNQERKEYGQTGQTNERHRMLDSSEYEKNRVNYSQFVRVVPQQMGEVEQFLKQMRVFLIWLGNGFLIVCLCVGLLMMISYMLNKRNRTKTSLLRQMMKKMSQQGKKRTSKGQKDLLCN